MAKKYWLGTADPVAQVSTVQITGYDSGTTYTLTVGDAAVSVIGTASAAGTAAALAAAWEASAHPYFAAVSASDATDTVTLTANIAGVPFVVSSSVTGGSGTIGSVAESTASAGPNDWSTGDNWSDGSVPANTDTVVFRENAISVCWGLDQSAVAINDLFIEKTYTGKIGLSIHQFVTSSDGETQDPSKTEYRETYLKIDVDVIEIGKHVGSGTAVGSGRVKINNTNSGASSATIFETANTPTESTLAAVRLLANSASADFFVRGGSVGFAIDDPTETATVGDIYIDGTSSRVFIGSGVTLSTYKQTGGSNLVQAAATVASVNVEGGNLSIEGDFTITTFTQSAGVVYDNHTSSGNAITTANLSGGSLITTRSSEPRTYSVVNLDDDASLEANGAILTITTLNEPPGSYTLTAS